MGRLLVGILAIIVASGQPLPNLGFGSANAGPGYYGPKNVYPGYSQYFAFSSIYWRVPVTCSATGNTCDAAGSGWTPLGTETGVQVTAITPPAGLETQKAAYVANYKICNVAGTVFQLGQGTSCATIETFTSTGTGVSILLTNAAAGISSHTYITSNTGWPSGTTLKWGISAFTIGWISDAIVTANGNAEDVVHSQYLTLRATIPTNATPGDYPVSIVMCTADTAAGACAGTSDTLNFTITVVALTFLSDAAGPTSFPPISSLSTWVSYMTDATKGGGKWCNKATGATNPTNVGGAGYPDNTVAFYDGGDVLHRIANYLRDPGWDLCATNIQQQAAWGNVNSGGLGNIIPLNGALQGYNIFPVGFEKMVLEDPRYIGVDQYFAGLMDHAGSGNGGAYVGQCSPADIKLREDSYGFGVMLAIDRLHLAPKDPAGTAFYATWAQKRQMCADVILGILDSYTNGLFLYNQNQYYQSAGLATDALIKWWQESKDPRVPILVKKIIDQYWSNYNQTSHIAMWTPDSDTTPRCAGSASWFVPVPTGHCDETAAINNNDLNNLIVHAFGWLWRVTGDSAYQTEGDEVFAHEFDNPSFNFLGKTFSQAYYHSFNYVGWRQGWLSPEKSIE
jgi:hypothetical protein